MTYTARDRDRHRLAVSAVTGAVTVGSLTSVGWLAGAAARDLAQDQAEREAAAARQQAEYAALVRAQRRAKPGVVLRERPTRVRVTTRYVSGAAPAPVGAGGAVSVPTSGSSGLSGSGGSGGSGSGGSGSGGSGSGSPGPSAPPPPPPPPPPPSSSGS